MSKIIYVGRNPLPDLSGEKAAMIKFPRGNLFPLSVTKRFSVFKPAYEQLKRWVSSSAFSAIVLDGLAALDDDMAEAFIWLNDHASSPDFPTLYISGDGEEKLKGLDYSK